MTVPEAIAAAADALLEAAPREAGAFHPEEGAKVGLLKLSEEGERSSSPKFSDELQELHWSAFPAFSVWQTGHSMGRPNHCPDCPKMQVLATMIAASRGTESGPAKPILVASR